MSMGSISRTDTDIAGVKLTHPEKDALGGAGHHQNQGLADFYADIADWILPTCQRTGLEFVAMPLRHRWQVLFRQASQAQATRRWRGPAPINLRNLSAARRRRRFHTPTFALAPILTFPSTKAKLWCR